MRARAQKERRKRDRAQERGREKRRGKGGEERKSSADIEAPFCCRRKAIDTKICAHTHSHLSCSHVPALTFSVSFLSLNFSEARYLFSRSDSLCISRCPHTCIQAVMTWACVFRFLEEQLTCLSFCIARTRQPIGRCFDRFKIVIRR